MREREEEKRTLYKNRRRELIVQLLIEDFQHYAVENTPLQVAKIGNFEMKAVRLITGHGKTQITNAEKEKIPLFHLNLDQKQLRGVVSRMILVYTYYVEIKHRVR